jgi:hypothetical protein
MATATNLPAAQTTGNVLTAAYMNDLRGAFRVLQFKYIDTTTQVTSASATYVDLGLEISITPQSTSNKIFLLATTAMRASGGAMDIQTRFLRAGSSIFFGVQGFFQSGDGTTPSMMYLDSPNTTSATIYKVQGSRNFGSGTALFQANGSVTSSFIVAEISA